MMIVVENVLLVPPLVIVGVANVNQANNQIQRENQHVFLALPAHTAQKVFSVFLALPLPIATPLEW